MAPRDPALGPFFFTFVSLQRAVRRRAVETNLISAVHCD